MPGDILVLGGGPAGLSTALHLARFAPALAARILVLEKAQYPRPKLCGGALTSDAEVMLQGLGLDVTEIPHVDASAAHLDFAGKGLVVAPRGRHVLRIIQRLEFDAWLAQKARLAGIQIREGVTVRRVVPHAESVTVETHAGSFEAAVVVGADGSNGVTRRSILPAAPIHTARLLEALIPASGNTAEPAWPVPTLPVGRASERRHAGAALTPAHHSSASNFAPPILGADADAMGGNASSAVVRGHPQWRGSTAAHAAHEAKVAYFDFAPVPVGIAGYTWDFPTQLHGQPMRCWGIYDANLLAVQPRPQLRSALEKEMQLHGASLESVELQGYPIRWFNRGSPLSVPRVLLVGDAAGADGIFGEGISIALGYGRLAAQAILAGLASGDLSFRDYRARVLTSPLGRALTARTAITYILYLPHWAWFQRLFWRVFKPVVDLVSMLVVMNWAKRMR